MDNRLVAEKVLEIQTNFTKWAEEVGIVGPGEFVELHIEIKIKPLARSDKDKFLEMRMEKFFTAHRIEQAGFPVKGNLARISQLWTHNNNPGFSTVRDLVNLGEYGICRRCKNVGKGTTNVVTKVLRYYGIEF